MKLDIRRSKQPKWTAPMLATLSKNPFFEPGWIYERKLDGMRCLLHKDGDQIKIWSRNKISQNSVYPELVAALKKYPSDFILDCEVVTFVGKKTDFAKLGMRMHVKNPDPQLIKKVPVTVFVFDILYLNDYNLTELPLLTRKKILKDNFKFIKPLKYLAHRKTNGANYYEQAARSGWEGLIAKQEDSIYVHQRTRTWLKFKCDMGQELVIGGYTKPAGTRVKFGALLLGYYENGKFKYAGRVGTGFNVDTLLSLYNKMKPLEVERCPFNNFDSSTKDITWVKPKLVAQLGFAEWTSEGRLRHPRFLGLRTDKKAAQVTRESK